MIPTFNSGVLRSAMQAAFNDNWIKTRGQVLYGKDYFPELPEVNDSLAQVFKSSKGEGSESVRLMYLLSIASATKSIQLEAAYCRGFSPAIMKSSFDKANRSHEKRITKSAIKRISEQ